MDLQTEPLYVPRKHATRPTVIDMDNMKSRKFLMPVPFFPEILLKMIVHDPKKCTEPSTPPLVEWKIID